MKRARVLLALSPFAIPLLALAMGAARAQGAPRAGVPRATSAVRLATLAERVVKLDAQIGQAILVERSRRGMAEALRDFEATHRELLAAAGNVPELREPLRLLALLWQDYRAAAARPPTRDNARRLGERAEEVVWVAMKSARILHGSPRSASGALAFKAAEACTLSQRIPRLHIWRRWGIRDERLLNELRLSEVQLHAAIASLRAVAANPPGIASELQVAESQAAFLAQASKELEGGRDAARHLEFVAKAGDHILEAMERVARLYDDPTLR